jgi:hypothetical protein
MPISKVTQENLKIFYWDMQYASLRKIDGSADMEARLTFRKTHPEFNKYGIDNGWWKAITDSGSSGGVELPSGIEYILR